MHISSVSWVPTRVLHLLGRAAQPTARSTAHARTSTASLFGTPRGGTGRTAPDRGSLVAVTGHSPGRARCKPQEHHCVGSMSGGVRCRISVGFRGPRRSHQSDPRSMGVASLPQRSLGRFWSCCCFYRFMAPLDAYLKRSTLSEFIVSSQIERPFWHLSNTETFLSLSTARVESGCIVI